MRVEIVYATQSAQKIIELLLDEDSTVQDAVRESGLCEIYTEIEVGVTPVGIYSERVQYDTVLRDGDRVEIYRPLEVDPMEARRLRAKSQANRNSKQKSKSDK